MTKELAAQYEELVAAIVKAVPEVNIARNLHPIAEALTTLMKESDLRNYSLRGIGKMIGKLRPEIGDVHPQQVKHHCTHCSGEISQDRVKAIVLRGGRVHECSDCSRDVNVNDVKPARRAALIETLRASFPSS